LSADASPSVGIALSGGELLLGPEGVRYARMAIAHAARAMHRDGLPLPTGALYLQALLEQASCRIAASDIGSAEVPSGVGLSLSQPVDPVTATEAARMFGCTTRNVTLKCSGGRFASAVKVSGVWLIERAEVESAVAERDVA
jgi:hypothetical protein